MKSAIFAAWCISVALAPSATCAAATPPGLTRSFVSSNGSDSNDCSRQAPCRSFATAIGKTAAGGEINTLDPGGYGPVTINKSISIVSGLGEAGVLVPPGGVGITIDAGSDDQINLRGLAIEGAGTGSTGILFNHGGSLTISASVVRNMTGNGIDLQPGTNGARFTITDTIASDNARCGVYLYPQFSQATATLTRVTASNNQWGVYVNGNANPVYYSIGATITDSVISQNTKGVGYGVYGNGTPSQHNVSVYVAGTVASFNRKGIVSDNSFLYASGATVVGNLEAEFACATGLKFIFSFQNNTANTNQCLSATGLQ